MIILGIDTSTLVASAAIVDGDRVIAGVRQRDERRGRTTDLLVLIDELCRRAAIGPGDLDAVAIGAGPGSFTSLRIGMATAKGIAFASTCPLWAVSSLAALAHEQLDQTPQATVTAVLDARRAEVYAGTYRRDGKRTVVVGDERVMPPADLVAFVPSGARVVADVRDIVPSFPAAQLATPTGAAVARLALTGMRVDVLISGTPTYIRPSEAEVKYPDGVPGALRTR